MVRSAYLFSVAAVAAAISATDGLTSRALTERQDVSAAGNPGWGHGSKKPKVNSKKLQQSIRESALSKKAKELEEAAYSTSQRNRVFSSEGHLNTLDLIEGYLDTVSDYYTYRRQPFEALYSQASGNFSAAETTYTPIIFQYSPSGTATAPLVAVANEGCAAEDYPAEVANNIALIVRGTCDFGLKSSLAGAAGAVGAVIYNNAPGYISGGTLGPPPRPEGEYIPTAGISQENATVLLEALSNGEEVQGVLEVESIIENRTTYNIIADTKGGDKENILVLGGHSDSVYAGPGINDDGSGIIGILETALQLAKYSTKNAIRFAFWSAEEFGLLGSEYYVANLSPEELQKIRLYLNFDMIASPNFIYGLYDGDGSAFNISGPPGSAEAEAFFAKWFKDQGLATTETDFDGRSDYGPFLDAGVPAGGIFTGAEELKTEEEAALFGGEVGVAYDVNYHQAGDNYTNLNFEAFVTNTKAIAAAVAEYGSSFDSLSPRNATATVKARGVHAHPHERRQKAKHVHHTHDCGKAPKVFI
ncbi:hypothetical protein M409DRAFT_64397 [Zasmidium cellare ATCC 36951]|uniref:Peptide hydrolase n=1 Tax=Zasmidium cellare ATCC 36951 TaxID=1080233 RepID=A0A6A6CW22_ZASCE|nr:uncharacterized protein M409DRAFT_64397 [Zasmidium cellare ATCC 36951]KAF2170012.1 hypothetical protein M409DRAFT_64397 [Zasmidium cellare ATCC 36951]